MQRYGFRELYAWLVSLHLAAWIRGSVQGKMTEASASPILGYAAVTLFLLLAILEIDLHQDELGALGFVAGEEGAVPNFAGP